MPNAVVLKVDSAILPQGFCAQSYQDLANAFANIYSVTLPTESDMFVVQSNDPGVQNQGKFWLQTDTLGRPIRIYWYAQGHWLSLHPEQPGMIKILTGSPPNLDTYDGGAVGPVTEYTGPMWEIAAELNAVFPVGSTSTSAFASGATVHPGDTGGEEKHILTSDELAPHNHFIVNKDAPSSGGNVPTSLNTVTYAGSNGAGDTAEYSLKGTATRADRGMTSDTGGVNGVAVGHNNLPPYLAVTFIKRTNRLFYTP